MNNNSNLIIKTLASVLIGTLIGYYLWVPVLQISPEDAKPFILAIGKIIDPYLVSNGAGFITIVIITFFLRLPNILILALVSLIIIRLTKKPRQLLYPVLLAPTGVLTFNWYDVLRFKLIFQKLGRPSDFEHLPTALYLPSNSLMIFLTYSVFLAIVMIVGNRYMSLQGTVRDFV